MVYLIGGRLSFTNDSRRDNAVTQIQAYAAQFAADLFVPASVGSYDGTYKGWPHACNFEMVFRTLVNRDDLWTQADAKLGSGVQGPVTGSMLWRVDINADDPYGPQGTFSATRVY